MYGFIVTDVINMECLYIKFYVAECINNSNDIQIDMIYMIRALWLNCAGLRARVAAILFDPICIVL